jgi:Zn2+/Cd2+-exporting ATPase
VKDASVNFAASKITVYGKTTVSDLEQAGAFDHITIVRDQEEPKQIPFLQKYSRLLLAVLFMLSGYISGAINGEQHIITIIAFALSIVVGGYHLFQTGLRNLLRLQFDMRTLMTIAIIGAAIIGEWSEGAVVVILFAISEALEKYSMDKARNSIRMLMEIAPKEASIRRNGAEIVVPVEAIHIGDTMLVKPGQKLAMDGVVLVGVSAVNQATITGESVPVEKAPADEVFAGTMNGEGYLEVKVTKRVEDTTISKIIHLVEEAQGERAPSQAFIDRFAQYYTPIIIIIAGLVALVPPLLWNGDWSEWIYQGLAVLVVGCPCALVISTPVAIVTAVGNAARNGVLIKGGVYLEEMASLKAIAFDKTGTLTKGSPIVTDTFFVKNGSVEIGKVESSGGNFSEANSKEVWAPIAALEAKSQHPLASAMLKKATDMDVDYKKLVVEEFQSFTGKGITGNIDGIQYYIGNEVLFVEELKQSLLKSTIDRMTELQLQGKTVMLFGTEKGIIAILAVADEIRESSRNVIQKLKSLGINQTIMLTGDNPKTAEAIGRDLAVTDIQANLLPEEKLQVIKSMRESYGKVAMVGDGVNDAPALAAATVGIAMGGAGTDAALETADVALMGDDLEKLPFTIKLSRKALAIIKQNITFSIGIKIIALLLVIPGWLTLWIAIFADMGATLIVTLNGLRLLKIKDK